MVEENYKIKSIQKFEKILIQYTDYKDRIHDFQQMKIFFLENI